MTVDQISKWLINGFFMRHSQSVPVIPDIFHLTFVRNTGVAFGLFRDREELLLIAVSLSLLVFVVYLFFLKEKRFVFQMAYGMILGGAIGNLIDRIRQGWVFDFLDFRIWPVFNLADTFICIGVGILFLEMLIAGKKDNSPSSFDK